MASDTEEGVEDAQQPWLDSPTLEPDESLLNDRSRNGKRLRARFADPEPEQRGQRRGMVAFLCIAFLVTALSISFILSDWTFYASTSHGDGGSSPAPSSGHDDEADHDHADAAATTAIDIPSLAKDFILDPNWDFDAAPQLREYNWVIKDTRHNPDGVFRQMMLVNDQYPGPLIEVNEGDTIRVRLSNQAANATSLHWHGMYQNGTNHMDGTIGVTQCPIAPGKSFTYEFTVSGQSGTYWWHSHQAMQSADGLHGPLVVHSKKEKTELQRLEYASDRVVMVSDYYHDPSPGLLMTYLASDRENVEPVPDGALINGHGKRDCSKVPQRECDSASPHVGFPRLDLEKGKSHRLRIINVGSFAEFQVSLDEHDFAVTEVDGTDVEPVRFDRLSVLPAQRYSIIVDSVDPPEHFWLRAKMLPTCFREKNAHLETDALAIVNAVPSDSGSTAAAAEVQPPASKDWDFVVDVECRDMNTSMLTPVAALAAPAHADKTIYLRANFEIGAHRLSRGFFNDSSFRADVASPTLLRALDGAAAGNASFSSAYAAAAWVNDAAFARARELVVQTRGAPAVDVLVGNFDDGAHPFHLHGHKFWVLAQGHGYPPAGLAAGLDVRNPLRRDTATVEGYGWALLRFVADNPGVWALHCHVQWHAEAGLLMQFLAQADRLHELDVPARHRELCDAPLAELQKGAVPADEVFMAEDE